MHYKSTWIFWKASFADVLALLHRADLTTWKHHAVTTFSLLHRFSAQYNVGLLNGGRPRQLGSGVMPYNGGKHGLDKVDTGG